MAEYRFYLLIGFIPWWRRMDPGPIRRAVWNKERAGVGESVTMTAEIERLNENTNVIFEVYEKDFTTFDDFITRFEVSATRGQDIIVGKEWNLEYQRDCWRQPEYIFRVKIGEYEKESANELEFNETTTVSGRVTDQFDNSIAGAIVEATAPDGTVLSSQPSTEDGNYVITGLRENMEYTIIVRKEPFFSELQPQIRRTISSVRESVEQNISINLISIRISDSVTDREIDGATVSIDGNRIEYNAIQHTYDLILPQGEYTFTVSHSDYNSATLSVSISAEGRVTSESEQLREVLTNSTGVLVEVRINTIFRLTELRVSGAIQEEGSGGINYISAKDDSGNVTIDAVLNPLQQPSTDAVISWEGGEEVRDNPFQRTVPLTSEGQTTVTAIVGTTTLTVNIYVEESRCTVCKKMLDLLNAQGSNAEFGVSSISPTLDDMSNLHSTYMSFIADNEVRMRYYIQAHLHWFGYYPELINASRHDPHTPLLHNDRIGFPQFHVDGRWGENSKVAYKRFLDDVGTEGTTGWLDTEDIIRRADIELIWRKCRQIYHRPNYNYYLNYQIHRNNPSGTVSQCIRPFLLRRDYLHRTDPPTEVDLELRRIIEEEEGNGCEPAPLSMGGHPISAMDAPHDFDTNIRNVIRWPIVTSNEQVSNSEGDYVIDSQLPEELRILIEEKRITRGDINTRYRLYRYNPERWRICYRGNACSSDHIHMSGSGRRFDASRSSGDRMHGGVDLFGDYGDPVRAMLDGQIVGFHNAAPIGTCFLFIHHAGLHVEEENDGITINYGEVHHESLIRMGLMVGDTVIAGQLVGAIGRMTDEGRHAGSMMHFEIYRGICQQWAGVNSPDFSLHGRLNPYKFLITVREQENSRMPPP